MAKEKTTKPADTKEEIIDKPQVSKDKKDAPAPDKVEAPKPDKKEVPEQSTVEPDNQEQPSTKEEAPESEKVEAPKPLDEKKVSLDKEPKRVTRFSGKPGREKKPLPEVKTLPNGRPIPSYLSGVSLEKLKNGTF